MTLRVVCAKLSPSPPSQTPGPRCMSNIVNNPFMINTWEIILHKWRHLLECHHTDSVCLADYPWALLPPVPVQAELSKWLRKKKNRKFYSGTDRGLKYPVWSIILLAQYKRPHRNTQENAFCNAVFSNTIIHTDQFTPFKEDFSLLTPFLSF